MLWSLLLFHLPAFTAACLWFGRPRGRGVLSLTCLSSITSWTCRTSAWRPSNLFFCLSNGDWVASIDLREMYLQVPVHLESRRFLRFVAHGRTYQFTALCFGLSTAPQVFTRVMAPVSAILHSLGNPYASLPGRLALPGLLPGGSPPGSRGCLVPLSRVGDRNQPGEVQLLPVSGGPVSWDDHQRTDFYGFSIARSRLQAAVNRRRISALRCASCQLVAVAAGDVVLSVTSGSRGPPADEVAPDLPSPLLGSVASFSSCGVVSGLSSGPSVVASRGSPLSRGLSPSGIPGSGLLVRRFRRRMGGSLGRQGCFRPLGPVGGSSSSQCQGVAGGSSLSPPLPVLSVRDHGGSVLRQRHRSRLSSQGGRHPVSCSQHHYAGDPPLSGFSSDSAGSPVHSGDPQCSRGLSLPSSSAPQLRVVSQHGRISIFDTSVAGDDRPLCHLRQSLLLHLFLALPRPSFGGDGRAPPVLGWSPGVCFSAVVHSSSGIGEASGVPLDPPHPSHPLLASASVVRGPPPVVGDSSCSARLPLPATVSSALPGSPQAVLSCLETIQRFTRAVGFSSVVAAQALAGRPSRGSPLSRGLSPSGIPGSGLLVRCFRRRMGGSLGRQGCFRPLGPIGGSSSSQCQGVAGGSSRSPPLPVLSVRDHGGSVLRQRHLSSQGGRHPVSCSQHYCAGDPPLSGFSSDSAGSPVHSGDPQCSRGLSLPSSSAPQLRVVSQHGRISIFDTSVAGDDRPLCHLRHSLLLHLFLALPRPSFGGDGRAPPVLGRSPGVCFSAVVHSSSGIGEASGVPPDPPHPSHPLLASASVVCGPPPVVGDSSCSARLPLPATVSSALPGSPQAVPLCLETIQRFTRAVGFSSVVAAQASLARRPSSRSNYQLKWSVYRSWCRFQGHFISRPSLSKVADFLWWLCSVRGLSVSSIKGYRSMLSAVFRFHLPALSTHPVLRDLLHSFRVSAPSYPMWPPSWDLLKVLRFLLPGAFEPLRDAPLRTLSKKVLFLLALATAKCVGELQALSLIVSFVGGDACLSYVPEFVAKSESLSRSIPRSFLVKSLSDFAAGLDDDLLLCSVRALRIYLDRTLSLAPSRCRLFVSKSCPMRVMSKNVVSFFLREVIHGDEAARPEVGTVRAHDIRGVSTSVVLHRNWPVSVVLDAATWSSSLVFTSFYLRDLQHEFQGLQGLRSLGPFVAAGSRIA